MSIFEKHIFEDPRLPFIFHDYTFRRKTAAECIGNWHENIEILYFRAGNATVINNESRIEVTSGDTVVINANFIHDIIAYEDTSFYCLIVDRAFCIGNHFDTNLISFTPHIKDKEIAGLMEEVALLYRNKAGYFKIPSIRAVALKLLSVLGTRYSSMETAPYTETNLLSAIKLALGYIHSNIERKLVLDEIAKKAGVSKYYLAHEFHRVTGYTVINYINRVRCDKAAKLLSEESRSIESIAESCGFTNASYFTRTFFKLYGVRPTEYRAQYNRVFSL